MSRACLSICDVFNKITKLQTGMEPLAFILNADSSNTKLLHKKIEHPALYIENSFLNFMIGTGCWGRLLVGKV